MPVDRIVSEWKRGRIADGGQHRRDESVRAERRSRVMLRAALSRYLRSGEKRHTAIPTLGSGFICALSQRFTGALVTS
jgi:hypothetical protein